MPRSWICLLACSTGLIVGFQDPDDGLPPPGAPAARPRIMVPGGGGLERVDDLSLALAGLREASSEDVLTWERAYKLAFVWSRTDPKKATQLGLSIDPRRLDEEAKRVGFGDFARFRDDVLAGPPGGPRPFRDPMPALFESLRLARSREESGRSLTALERYVRTCIDQAQGDPELGTAPGMNRLDDALQVARTSYLWTTRRFREGLDSLKVELGLTPEAPVVPDRSILAAFGEAFEAAEAWMDSPDKALGRLDQIALGLPKLEDISIEGRSIFDEARRLDPAIEGLLHAVARVAIERRDARGGTRRPEDEDVALLLRVRREVRLLQDYWLDQPIARRQLVLLVRQTEQARAAVFGPPPIAPLPEWEPMSRLVEVRMQLQFAEDRLVTSWINYQLQRFALLRDLGMLPADDWPAFFASITARKPSKRVDPHPRAASGLFSEFFASEADLRGLSGWI